MADKLKLPDQQTQHAHADMVVMRFVKEGLQKMMRKL